MNSININGKLHDLSHPLVMQILNVSPESFYTHCDGLEDAAERMAAIVAEHPDILDIGGCSTKPNSTPVSEEEEWQRLEPVLKMMKEKKLDVITSVDTFRSDIARRCVEEYGVNIINDVTGGAGDPNMFATVAELQVPYVLTYNSPVADGTHIVPAALKKLSAGVNQLHDLGVNDIIIDPGFGFNKTHSQEYELMNHLDELQILGLPILVGISHKSMITTAGYYSEQHFSSLHGTIALNLIALERGANILRVHEASECRSTIALYETLHKK